MLVIRLKIIVAVVKYISVQYPLVVLLVLRY